MGGGRRTIRATVRATVHPSRAQDPSSIVRQGHPHPGDVAGEGVAYGLTEPGALVLAYAPHGQQDHRAVLAFYEAAYLVSDVLLRGHLDDRRDKAVSDRGIRRVLA